MATRTAETPKAKKTPVRRCLTHLPATCEAALAALNDAAWEVLAKNNAVTPNGATMEVVLDAMTAARKILKDGLSAVEPRKDSE